MRTTPLSRLLRLLMVIGGAMTLLVSSAALAGAGETTSSEHVMICHACGKKSSPYVMISPSKQGVVSGHYDHQDERDIIPEFDFEGDHYAGQNLDEGGQEILDAGCVVTDTGDNGTDNGGTSTGNGDTGNDNSGTDNGTDNGDKGGTDNGGTDNGGTDNGGNDNGGNGVEHVTICHATGSESNPYVVNSPSKQGVLNGHYPHQDERDIIPAFDFEGDQYAGQNLDDGGQAILDDDCVVTDTGDTGNDNGDNDNGTGDNGDNDNDNGTGDTGTDNGDTGNTGTDTGDTGGTEADNGGTTDVVSPPVEVIDDTTVLGDSSNNPEPKVHRNGHDGRTAVLGATVSRTPRSTQLPRTGSDTAETLAPAGLALLLAGIALEWSARRRRRALTR